MALHQDIEHIALLIHGPPQIMLCPVDCQKHLVQVPFIAWSGTTTSQLIRIVLPEGATPLPDGFIRHNNAAGEQEFFDISIAQAEAIIEPHAVADDVRRKAVVLVTVRCSWRGHAWPPLYLRIRGFIEGSSQGRLCHNGQGLRRRVNKLTMPGLVTSL